MMLKVSYKAFLKECKSHQDQETTWCNSQNCLYLNFCNWRDRKNRTNTIYESFYGINLTKEAFNKYKLLYLIEGGK